MSSASDEQPTIGAQATYLVVLRARSSARFAPEDGFEASFHDVPGSAGPVRFRVRTIWVEEGHEAPTPRELMIEARGPAPSLDHALAKFGPIGRLFSNLLSLTANTSVDIPEVQLAYDATVGRGEREFVQVFLPDERGIPAEGRIVRSAEVAAIFEGLQQSKESGRLGRAIQQYGLALRYWYFGGEWLALAHLYMAVETLAAVVIADSCTAENLGKEDLAQECQIDTSEKNWKHKLDVWARREVIFEGDYVTYRDARHASDGIEHGFLELEEVNKKAVAVAAKTFRYVRSTVLRLLGVEPSAFSDLWERAPRDVGSMRKMIRGKLIGDGGDPAPPNEFYPRLAWTSAVKTIQREEENFTLSFQEKFTVHCAPTYGFQGTAIEVRGRAEPGGNPIRLNPVVEVLEPTPSPDARNVKAALDLLRRANALATDVAGPSMTTGIPALMLNVFSLFSQQIALLEGIDVLLRDNRPVEAMVLLRSLILGTCQLEVIANSSNPIGVALRIKLDSLDRQMGVLAEPGSAITERGKDQVARYWTKAAESGIEIPEKSPDIHSANFFRENANSLRFADEVARPSDLATTLHTTVDDAGNRSIAMRVTGSNLLIGVAVDAVDAVIASAKAAATTLGWPIDEALVAAISADTEALMNDAE